MRLSDALEVTEVESDKANGQRPPTRTMRLGDGVSFEVIPMQFIDGLFVTKPEDVAAAKAKGPIGAVEQWRRMDKSELAPFNPESMLRTFDLFDAVNRLREDQVKAESRVGNFLKGAGRFGLVGGISSGIQTPLDAKERRELDIEIVMTALRGYEEERIRGRTWGAKVTEGLAHMPSYLVEFIATGGLAAFGKKGIQISVERIAKEAMKNRVVNFTTRAVGTLAGAGLRTAAMPHRIVDNYATRRFQAGLELTDKGIDVLIKRTEKPLTSALKALGDVWIENFSEVLGTPARRIVSKFIPKGLKKSFENMFIALGRQKGVTRKASDLWSKVGFDGFLEEMGEERIGAFLRRLTGVRGFQGNDPHNIMDQVFDAFGLDVEQLLVEAGIFGFPGALRIGTAETFNILDKRRKAQKLVEKRQINEVTEKTAIEIAGIGQPEKKEPEPEVKKPLQTPEEVQVEIDEAKEKVKGAKAEVTAKDKQIDEAQEEIEQHDREQVKPVEKKFKKAKLISSLTPETRKFFEEAEAFKDKAILKEPDIVEAETGEPIIIAVIRGFGRAKGKQVLAEGVTQNVFGEAIYFAINESTAKQFGPKIIKSEVKLENPFVINNNADLRTLFGEDIPLENEAREPLLRAARQKLLDNGHDGVIVNIPRFSDEDLEGNPVKRIKEIFRDTQVIKFPTKAAEVVPPVGPSLTTEQAEAQRKQLLDKRDALETERIPLLLAQTKLETKQRRKEKKKRFFESRAVADPRNRDELLAENRRLKEENTLTKRAQKRALSIIAEIGQSADLFLGEISTRVGNISKKLKNRLRRFEFDTMTKIAQDQEAVLPFVQGMNKMDKADQNNLDFALKNGWVEVRDEILKKYDLTAEYEKVREVLERLYKDSKAVGLDVEYLKDMHPRAIRDLKGLVDFFVANDIDGTLQDAFNLFMNESGETLDDEQKAELINSLLRGKRSDAIELREPAALKDRKIKQMTPEINGFYYRSDSALSHYIFTVNTAIETNKFFGRGETDARKHVDDSIGALVIQLVNDGEITFQQQADLTTILKARFNQTGTHGLATTFKNIAYIDVLGSPLKALTQLGDLTLAAYKNGFYNTTIGALNLQGVKIDRKDLGITDIGVEFQEGRRSHAAAKFIFKIVGFTAIDTLGKNAVIRGSYLKYRKLALEGNEQFKKDMEFIFEEEAAEVIEDLKNERVTVNVKFLLASDLMDLQPITLSEMPQKYLTAGNGRVFYMLKSFMIKVLDIYRNDVIQLWKTDPTQAFNNLMRLSAAMIIGGAGPDFLKDLILGRPINLSDTLINNILKIVGFNKFLAVKASRQGAIRTALETIIPPTKGVDAALKDIGSVLKDGTFPDQWESINSIPLGGELYYWWFGKGRTKLEKGRATSKRRGSRGRRRSKRGIRGTR